MTAQQKIIDRLKNLHLVKHLSYYEDYYFDADASALKQIIADMEVIGFLPNPVVESSQERQQCTYCGSTRIVPWSETYKAPKETERHIDEFWKNESELSCAKCGKKITEENSYPAIVGRICLGCSGI